MPRGGSEVIFTSRQAVFDGATAIRGGIPLCLPEFGVGINGDAVPKHGWARIAPWRLLTVTSTDGGGVRALLSVSRDHLTALYEVEVGETLRLGLSLRNEGSEPRTVERPRTPISQSTTSPPAESAGSQAPLTATTWLATPRSPPPPRRAM